MILASTSARRRDLLTRAGIAFDVVAPAIDDGKLSPGAVTPDEWVTALAYMKAASVWQASGMANTAPVHPTRANPGAPTSVILGADTVVVHGGVIFGQPRDEADARRMLVAMRDAEHDALTGVALLDGRGTRRDLFVDRARVRVGHISDAQIEEYLGSGQWRGKAGAYNLAERKAAGWPISVEGDEGTVMGLPVRMLAGRLRAFGASGAVGR